MNFHKSNVITGWVVFAIATIVFLLTIEPTSAFWDCGEFIASAYKLEVGHPPGAPFFMLLARLFAMLLPVSDVAMSVNILSSLCSSFTILFLFWSITHIAKKFAEKSGELTDGKLIAVLACGVVGALAYSFSDSFWFSAVEGEVYAMSSLFTAAVFWAILKWESMADHGSELRWIILIAYLMGLSIGVHLLNLLAIPAISFVYYFKRYEITTKGLIATSIIAIFLLGFVQGVIIPGTVKLAGSFELFFVNNLELPFNTGVITYAVLIIALITVSLWWTRKKKLYALNTGILGVMMMLIGYSTFAMIVIRSSANPPMDENNPENIFTLLSYLNREQYGDRPLLYGQYFNTPTDPAEPYKNGDNVWVKSYSIKLPKGRNENLIASYKFKQLADRHLEREPDKGYIIKEEYVESGEKKLAVPNYVKEFSSVFPRMYSSQSNHIKEYKKWSNFKDWNTERGRSSVQNLEAKKKEYEDKLAQYAYFAENHEDMEIRERARDEYVKTDRLIESLNKKLKPSKMEDIRFFLRYQVGWMYWRYFMWNYSGKQNDIQGHGNILEGNWISGVDFVDSQRLGNQEELPSSMTSNRAYNKFYFLPLLLGLIGMIFQFRQTPKDFVVVALLFALTGLAIVVYLNQYPMQPRERDYAYAGSFYAFAIWIGLSVYAFFHAATKMEFKDLGKIAAGTLGASVVMYVLELMAGGDHAFSYALIWMSLVTLAGLAAMIGLGSLKNEKGKAIAAGALCLLVPLLMLSEGYNDHDRSDRRTAVDFAKNYLESVEKNAILFTNGDNDTFPLWYAQEVEGYRTDVRIVNLSLLNTDWYADQMKRKAYESDPVPFTIPEHQYRQGTRDIVILDNSRNKQDGYIDLALAMSIALDDERTQTIGDGKEYSYLPSNKFSIPVDSAAVIANGTVSPENADKIVDAVEWEINRSYILKNNFMLLDLLRNNNWERPIYFAVTTGPDSYIGLEQYFQLEGLAYRLVPIKFPESRNPNVLGGIATDVMYQNVMNEFRWGGMEKTDDGGIYMDENNRRMTTNFRLQLSNLAEALGEEERDSLALNVLNRCMEVMPEENVPFDRVMLPIIEQFYQLGDSANGEKILTRLFEIFEEDMAYFYSLEPEFARTVEEDYKVKLSVNARLEQVINFYTPTSPVAAELTERFDALYEDYEAKLEELKRKRGRPADL